MLLENKITLVTGCSRGIGRAIMERFAEEGAIVYANARTEHSLDNTLAEMQNDFASRIIPLYFDIRNKDEIKKNILRIRKEQGCLDVLVNNAGIMEDALLEMVDDKVMKDTFETNVYAMIHMTQMACRLMGSKKQGVIVNLASIVGERGNEGQTVYAASKGAVSSLTKTWARELVFRGIRVNAIAPGNIDTALYRSIGEDRIRESIAQIGLKRLGKPKEVADTAVFLASDMSSYITGEILGVNGGWFL